jgi:gliding motility-associated-like protein
MKNFILICICTCIISMNDMMAQCGACRYEVDLINNGDFENGNAGFTTNLEYSPGPIFFCPLCDENTYAIGANATLYHSGFSGSDHTNPPTGDFLIANGPGQAGALVWCQTINVQPNTDYTFSFWARDVTNNNNPHPTALLQVSINGVLNNDTLNADGGWEEFTMTWNSESQSSLDICIINQQSLTGGNDFGLDDISFSGCHNYYLSQPAFAGVDTEVCSNEPLVLGTNSIAGYNYNWDNSIGLNSTSIAGPILSIENTGPDPLIETYTVTRDSANVGCIASDTITVTILPLPPFELGADLSICPGETATLNAGDNWDSVTWSNGAETSTISVSGGTYQVIVDFGICSVSDVITVNEIVLPEIELGDDLNICSTEPITLNAGVSGTWSDGSVGATLLVTSSGTYTFTYSNTGCSVQDEVTIEVTQPASIELPKQVEFCQGSSIELNAGVDGLWSTGELGSSITIASPGYYDIVVETGPCVAQAGTNAEMLPLPIVNLDEYASICEDDSLHLVAFAPSNDQYLWSTGDTLPDIYARNAGMYEVVVSNACGSVTDEIEVETYPCSWNLYVPSAFTPNDDGFNEGWRVYGYNVSNVQIVVYNRFGDAIFKANGMDTPWQPSTGVYDDVYNYRIQATAFDGEQIVQTGHLYLLR